jgi:integrase
MNGWIETRTASDGTKRYDACWRVGPKKRSKTFRKRKAADHFLVHTVQQIHAGTYVEIKPITFKDYAMTWQQGLDGFKPSTRRNHQTDLRLYLIPAFGDLPLSQIGPEEVNRYLASQDGRLRPKTLTNQLSLLVKILNDAVEGHRLVANRLHRSRAIRRPKAIREDDETPVEILTHEEVNRVLDALPAPWYAFFFTLVCTGLRLGEALALRWGDFDEDGQLHVRRHFSRGTISLPKTKRSRRTVDAGDQLVAVLLGVRRARFGEAAPDPAALIFPSRTGGPMFPENLRARVWRPTLRAAGVRHVTIHSLRHFYASAQIAQGENILYVSRQLGHSSVKITGDIYGHLFPNERRGAAGRFEQRLGAARFKNMVSGPRVELAGGSR